MARLEVLMLLPDDDGSWCKDQRPIPADALSELRELHLGVGLARGASVAAFLR